MRVSSPFPSLVLERIVIFELEHLDELGDLRRKKLIVEIMGKHSNIMFCDEDNKILDSIKHISGLVSSVREVLPASRGSSLTHRKNSTAHCRPHPFMKQVFIKPCDCFKALYTTFTGPSPAISHEICFRAGGHTALSTAACTDADKESLWNAFSEIITQVKNGQFSPCIVYENDVPAEYAALKLTSYPEANRKDYAEISSLLEDYYAEKNKITRIRQRSS